MIQVWYVKNRCYIGKFPFLLIIQKKTRTVTKNILQIYFSLIFITTFYREGRCCNILYIHVFLNYEGIHVDTAVGCVLICFTILYLFLSLTGLETASYHQQHITYLARLLLNSLLSHKYDDALQCLVGLCGACRRTPELFWRVI